MPAPSFGASRAKGNAHPGGQSFPDSAGDQRDREAANTFVDRARPADATAAVIRDRENFAEDLASAMGEQSAIILDAMDRWFGHVMERLDGADPARNLLPEEAAATGTSSPRVQSRPSGKFLARLDPRNSWDGWGHHQRAQLLPNGVVEVEPAQNTPGVVAPKVAVSGGTILKITIAPGAMAPRGGTKTFVRVVDQSNQVIGPEIALAGDRLEFAVYAPKRVRSIKIYWLAAKPSETFRFAVGSLSVESHSIDDWLVAEGAGAPVIASLASIPTRIELLEDCVSSLLAQCDRVRVFLNGYPETPAFLKRERVEVRRSQSFDDRGDAGKFAWIDAGDPPGYRVVVDDDLIFAPNFVETMVAALRRYDDKAVVGAHGILLKQPIDRYYAPSSRCVFHFQSAMGQDRAVHVLGTNSICFHSSAVHMRRPDFMWPNMADIFLARYAQRAGLSLISVARPANLVMSNRTTKPIDTIYEHSLNATGSRFDTSWIQDLIVKTCEPLTTRRRDRPKVAMMFLATTPEIVEAAISSWRSSCAKEVEWVLVIVDVSVSAAVKNWFAEWSADFEAHFVGSDGRNAIKRVGCALELCDRLETSLVALVEGSVGFPRREWIFNAMALLAPWAALVARAAPKRVAERGRGRAGAARNASSLVVISRERYRSLPEFGVGARTLGAALSAWLGSFGEPFAVGDEKLLAHWAALKTEVSLDEPAAPGEKVDAAFEWLAADEGRPAPMPAIVMPRLAINEVFEEVLVINLDRRPDRWRAVSARLSAAGLSFGRVQAVDGRDPDVRAEYERYFAEARIEAPEARQIRSSREFFSDYDSQSARAAYEETRVVGKAIRSSGAWAYLKTWKGILERALRARRSSLLVFDDDVILHKQARRLFSAAVGGLPPDWLVLQLGSLQHHWEPSWVRWKSSLLYSTNGTAVGSHAVGIKLEVIPYLLDQVNRMQMPFDIGPLSATVGAFSDRCYVVAPNVAIQSLHDSDVGTSKFHRDRDRIAAAASYRWRLEDYDFADGPWSS